MLYRGYKATLMRDIPYAMISFRCRQSASLTAKETY
jgi:hypothetical protein